MKSTKELIAPQQATLDKYYSSELAKQKWDNMMQAGTKAYQYYKYQKPMAQHLQDNQDAQIKEYSNLLADPSISGDPTKMIPIMEARNRSQMLHSMINPFDLESVPKIYASMYNPLGVADMYKPQLDMTVENLKGLYGNNQADIRSRATLAAALAYQKGMDDRNQENNNRQDRRVFGAPLSQPLGQANAGYQNQLSLPQIIPGFNTSAYE